MLPPESSSAGPRRSTRWTSKTSDGRPIEETPADQAIEPSRLATIFPTDANDSGPGTREIAERFVSTLPSTRSLTTTSELLVSVPHFCNAYAASRPASEIGPIRGPAKQIWRFPRKDTLPVRVAQPYTAPWAATYTRAAGFATRVRAFAGPHCAE